MKIPFSAPCPVFIRACIILAAAVLLAMPSHAQAPVKANKDATGVKTPAAKDEAVSPERTEPKPADQGKGTDSPVGETEGPHKKENRKNGTPVSADAAQKAAESQKKKLDWIERTLEYGIAKDRREAINLMLTVKDDAGKQRMRALILKTLKNDTDQEVIVKAITVGGDIQASEIGPELLRFLDDETEDVRTAAASGIHALNFTAARDALVKKLKAQDLSRDSNFTESIIRTLADFKAPEAREFAEAGIKDIKTTSNLREQLILFIGKCGIRESKDFLIKILKDPDENIDIRSYAASALSLMGIKEAAADINEVLKTIEAMPFKKRKEHYNLYMYCVAALVRLGDDGALPRLTDSLKNDNTMVRLKAVRLLKDLKDKRTIDILKYKKDYDPSPLVQRAAREALEEMGVTDGKDAGKPAAKQDEKPADKTADLKIPKEGTSRPDADRPAPVKQ
jgi:HEAT repeat protein